MTLDDAADIFTIVAGVATVVLALSVGFAFWQYRTGLRVQRAQWLVNLFEKFYEKDAYREVRGLIQSANEDDFLSKVDDDPDLEQKWTDYLNFFEFVAYLQKIGELKKEDIDAMFKYWIDSLSRPKFEAYLREYGYENLVQLLGTRGPPEERK